MKARSQLFPLSGRQSWLSSKSILLSQRLARVEKRSQLANNENISQQAPKNPQPGKHQKSTCNIFRTILTDSCKAYPKQEKKMNLQKRSTKSETESKVKKGQQLQVFVQRNILYVQKAKHNLNTAFQEVKIYRNICKKVKKWGPLFIPRTALGPSQTSPFIRGVKWTPRKGSLYIILNIIRTVFMYTYMCSWGSGSPATHVSVHEYRPNDV